MDFKFDQAKYVFQPIRLENVKFVHEKVLNANALDFKYLHTIFKLEND